MDPGVIGGIVGSSVGVLGGLIGTIIPIRNARSGPERWFIIKCAVACWFVASGFVVLLLTLPAHLKWAVIAPYLLFMLLGIPWMNRRQARIRSERRSAVPRIIGM